MGNPLGLRMLRGDFSFRYSLIDHSSTQLQVVVLPSLRSNRLHDATLHYPHLSCLQQDVELQGRRPLHPHLSLRRNLLSLSHRILSNHFTFISHPHHQQFAGSFPPAYFHVFSAILLNLIKMNTNLNNLFSKYLKGASMGSFLFVGLGYLALNSYYYVDVGHYAIKFNKLFGLSPQVYREGYNLKLPFIEQPIIYNVQTRENEIFAETANRDMQSIKLSVRVLFHPEVSKLDVIYTRLGKNYEQKILPAICNEILRTVVAQFSAAQLLSQRDQVSERIKFLLSERAAHFNIIIDNLAITDLTFGKEYLEAIEGKQVAQQEAERAKYEVEQAKEAKKSTIIKAEASAKSIELVGQASKNNPSYLDVRKIEYTEKIAQILAESRNKLLLNNDILNMSLPKTTSVIYEERPEDNEKGKK